MDASILPALAADFRGGTSRAAVSKKRGEVYVNMKLGPARRVVGGRGQALPPTAAWADGSAQQIDDS